MILKLHGHIGSTASALVDGQLARDEAERAWRHVVGCPDCRRLVERESWLKRRLAGLGTPAASVEAPPTLLGSLYDVDAWAVVDGIERRTTRRRAATALVGAGSVGLAVLALVAVSSPPAGRGEIPGNRAPAMIGNQLTPSGGATGTDVEDAAFGGKSR